MMRLFIIEDPCQSEGRSTNSGNNHREKPSSKSILGLRQQIKEHHHVM